ncbi:Endonuclease/exonuclease/phosphatase [Cantharellus anzutake]|uniref:Endonuclease/exonuclease/phosphatase n=1 Tax=Cantharellus anzutake TaxID=1750568 RepID=UPI001907ED69|nr:Endonuclease/exonuclease/phosphatase [Cantharellus anzutake]KAF8332849.1 Endonuclease/exonuclease/phosphatase [Cantharellus anzutake]
MVAFATPYAHPTRCPARARCWNALPISGLRSCPSLNGFTPITHYHQSPAGPHSQPHRAAASPPVATAVAQIPKHWQSQLDHYDACRKAGAPHTRARNATSNTRNASKGVAITDPNRITPKLQNGIPNDDTAPKETNDDEPTVEGPEGHPSSTVAPVKSPTLARPAVSRKAENTWNALDLGGMRLKNLAPTLFHFLHLTTLYLNHNQLTHIPSAISHLRNLALLDLSANQLEALPQNLACTLPPEIGSLHQLRMLGIEGNPLQASLMQIMQERGTQALIAHLRDMCPVPMPPPERAWRILQSGAERKAQDDSETFTVLSYNILWEKAATSTMYGYTPSWALSWNYRKEVILTELMNHDPDFMCLQEVDSAQYEEYFLPHLAERGYEGVYSPRGRARNLSENERRSVDGSATFFKSAKYRLVKHSTIDFAQVAIQRDDFLKNNDMFDRLLARDHIALVTLMENRKTGGRLIVANAYLLWDPAYRDVKLIQTGILMEMLKEIADWFARYPPRPPSEREPDPDPSNPLPPDPTYANGKEIPLVLAGDFNSIPGSGVYDFLLEGHVPSNHPDFMDYSYGKFTADGLRHDFGLRSAYAGIGELPLTNHTPSFDGVIDYIWHATSTLAVNAVLGEVDQEYLSKVIGFPNPHFPSDHICVMCEFRLKKDQTRSAPPAPSLNGNP